MSLYFGNVVSVIATCLIVSTLLYVIMTVRNHKEIEKWSRKIAVLAILGLFICIFVATRDNYHLSVQASLDSSVSAGLFTVESIQSVLCCLGGAAIAICLLISVFVKNQKCRKVVFFILSAVIVFKMLVIEISRWVV